MFNPWVKDERASDLSQQTSSTTQTSNLHSFALFFKMSRQSDTLGKPSNMKDKD
jgi:hypothetical protein